VKKPGISSIKRTLRQTLFIKRYRHSLGVASVSALVARKHGLDWRKAYLIGLLHDCGKAFALGKSRETITSVKMDEFERQAPPLWHAALSVSEAKRKFGIKDREILQAIRFHCIGRRKMKGLSKVLYVADYIEPYRVFKGVNGIRKCAMINLEQAFRMVVLRKTLYLAEKRFGIHPESLQLWRELMAAE
jgi:predicted HD superfamily hydrolase involved in NAD metabolism